MMMRRPEEANEEFAAWKLWVGNNCTWLYIGSQVTIIIIIIVIIIIIIIIILILIIDSQAAWAIFVVSLFFSKFGNVKLGSEESSPEYNNASW